MLYEVITGVRRELAPGPQHPRDGGTEEIGIEDADPLAQALQGAGQVDGDGGLADAALAARHQHDVADAGDGLLGLGVPGLVV